jgi:hypothetical protein
MITTKENRFLLQTKILAKKKTAEKYFIDDKQYRSKVLDEILFNENNHLASKFGRLFNI